MLRALRLPRRSTPRAAPPRTSPWVPPLVSSISTGTTPGCTRVVVRMHHLDERAGERHPETGRGTMA